MKYSDNCFPKAGNLQAWIDRSAKILFGGNGELVENAGETAQKTTEGMDYFIEIVSFYDLILDFLLLKNPEWKMPFNTGECSKNYRNKRRCLKRGQIQGAC